MVTKVPCMGAGCENKVFAGILRCEECLVTGNRLKDTAPLAKAMVAEQAERMSSKYPKYYKPVKEGTTDLDVYGVCQLFPVNDDTGCINHARKKLLVPGTRTGGKSFRDDIKEARDTLTRWLELNPE